jgi:lambda family phage portal protein
MARPDTYIETTEATSKRVGPSLIDRVVGYVNPVAGLRRATARELLKRAYEGASPADGWRPRRAGASANADVMADSAPLRHRARSLVQNVPYVARAVRQLVAQTVGTGITPRSLANNAAAVDDLWARFVATADADNLGNLYSLVARAYRASVIDGEVLIRIRPRRSDDGLPVPVQFQLLEIDWLDTSKQGTRGGNTIVNGIEYTPLGQRVFYWLYDRHPGEVVALTGRSGVTSSPVDAKNIIHYYSAERPGQGRGISRLAPVIATVRDLQLYEDAEAQRKNLETRLAVLASGDLSQMLNPPAPSDTPQATSTELGQLPSGGIVEVPAGVNLTTVTPTAAPGYVDYVKHKQKIVAGLIGVTYEMATGDGSEVNFSSARIGQQDVRREIEQEQWLSLVPNLCEPLANAFFEFAIMAGLMLRTQDRRMDWSTPRWDYVNPAQDVKADLDEVSGGLCSLSEKMRRRNLVPELVFTELASDLKRLEDDGTLARLAVLRGQGSAPAQPADADNKTDNNADDDEARMIDMLAGIMAPGPQAQA